MAKVAVGMSGNPLHPIACLYDVTAYAGAGGTDLYFRDWEHCVDTFKEALRQAEEQQASYEEL